MTAARQVPEAVRNLQLAASDPEVSAWVSANAGSGKTHVLAQRVISLLLKGEDPARILCITFTKAAAANMATRVFDTLAEWTALDDVALDRAHSRGRRAAQYRDPRSRAPAVRAGARDAGRAESADHPRLLHAACCISFRSRPMSRRASRCSTTSPSGSCWKSFRSPSCWKAPPTRTGALGRALEISDRIGRRPDLARRVPRSHCANATGSKPGSRAPARSMPPPRNCRQRSASTLPTRSRPLKTHSSRSR